MNKATMTCSECKQKKTLSEFNKGHKTCKKCMKFKLANRTPKIYGTYMGELRKGCDIFSGSKGYFIWANCTTCKIASWMSSNNIRKDGITMNRSCHKCYAKGTPLSNNNICLCVEPYTKKYDDQGYVLIYIPSYDKSYIFLSTEKTQNSRGAYVFEHRYVITKHLNRKLQKDENIHHINGEKDDNRLENLEIWITPQPSGARLINLVKNFFDILSDKECYNFIDKYIEDRNNEKINNSNYPA